MDASEVKKIAEEALPVMQRKLGVNDWTVKIEDQLPDPPSRSAEVTMNHRQQIAWITFSPGEAPNRADVLQSLRHELLHLYQGDHDACKEAARAGLTPTEFDIWFVAFITACERLNSRLERMFDGLGLTPEVLAGDNQRTQQAEQTGLDGGQGFGPVHVRAGSPSKTPGGPEEVAVER